MAIRELKARKAKYGFDAGKLYLSNVVQMGRFVEALQTECEPGTYILEEAGYNQPEVKIYTDDDGVAQWIRSYNFN